MKVFVYDITEHLSTTDCVRLKAAAEREGCTLGDYIESTLKRALFHPAPVPPINAAGHGLRGGRQTRRASEALAAKATRSVARARLHHGGGSAS